MEAYDEFGLTPRFPRIPFDEIRRLVSNAQEPQVFLRRSANGRTTDVTVRLPVGSSVVPQEMKKQYARHGVTLPRAFEDVLWEKLEARKSTIWANLTGLATQAYRRAWLQWFRLQYLGHFHPAAESMFKKLKQDIESASRVTHRGRKPAIQAERASLQKRYRELLPKCKVVHRAAKQAAAASLTEHNREVAQKNIRLAIWELVRRSIHGMPGDEYIFDGAAFKRIRNSGKAKLHDPNTWKPQQLAKALLSLERSKAYQTIEKILAPTKSNGSSSSTRI